MRVHQEEAAIGTAVWMSSVPSLPYPCVFTSHALVVCFSVAQTLMTKEEGEG